MTEMSRRYFLMHKDIPVCIMNIDDEGKLSKVIQIEETKEHFPPGGKMNLVKFHAWWADRAIPKTRHGVKTALQKLGYSSTNSALVNNLALSLSDCYWIKPAEEDSDLKWKDVNLFINDFADTFGDITLNPDYIIDLRNKTAFDCAASQGELQKKWCIDRDGRRFMVKGNYGSSCQQSLNEIFATKLHEQQGWDQYTPYYLTKLKISGDTDGLGCLSYDFCNENIEMISAWEMLQTVKFRQNESLYYPFRRVCLDAGMPADVFQRFMDYEIMTDFLMSNTDRHMNNIALLRNPDTLEIYGFAPIYDSGNSMFYNVPAELLDRIHLNRIETHSFIKSELKLLQYVHDPMLVDPGRAEMDFSIYREDVKERHARIPKLRDLYLRKLQTLRAFQEGQAVWMRRTGGRSI